MRIKHTISTAFEGLRTNKSRSLLTILGIVIGVAAIIIVMAISTGAQTLILDQISGLGQESVILTPSGGSNNPTGALFSNSLTESDIKALEKKSNVPNLDGQAYPYVVAAAAVEYGGETERPTMYGGSARFFAEFLDVGVSEGRFYGEEETEANERVVVMGQEIAEDLFGLREVVGQDVTIENRKYEVVGLFDDVGQVSGFAFDNMVIMPETTAHTYLTGNDSYQEVILRADSPENVDKFVYDITATLRDEHDLEPGDEDDFEVITQEEIADQISTVTTVLSALLAAMLSVALVVGGIGIMNIMLVSVAERTKEIGLRKALGATRRDIQQQFLYEAVMLTFAGGVVGILVGTLVSWIASVALAAYVVPGWTFSFPLVGAIIGVGVSTAIGLVFGIYPAKQAAKKSPIEALRYE